MQRCFNVLCGDLQCRSRLHRGGLATREQRVVVPRQGDGVQIRVCDTQQLGAMLCVLLVPGVLQQRAKLLHTCHNCAREVARHRVTALGCTPGTQLGAL
jgi:hypothetical protein